MQKKESSSRAGLGSPKKMGNRRLRQLFSILSNKESLRVFELASKGIPGTNTAFQKIKTSKANYYKKLEQLINFDLVTKDEQGTYRHTVIGEIVYQNQVLTLRGIAAEVKVTNVATKFVDKNKSSNKDFEKVVRDITRDLIAENDPGLWRLSELKLFLTIEQYFSIVTSIISNTKNELYLVARSLELPMVDAVLIAAENKARINIVYSDWRGFYSKNSLDPLDDLLKAASRNHPEAKLLSTSPTVAILRGDVPFSYVVSDGKSLALELSDHGDSHAFIVGIGLESGEVAERLISHHENLSSSIRKTELT